MDDRYDIISEESDSNSVNIREVNMEEENIVVSESNEVDNIEVIGDVSEDGINIVEYNSESFVILNFVYSKSKLFSPFKLIFCIVSSVRQERYNKYQLLFSMKAVENPFMPH